MKLALIRLAQDDVATLGHIETAEHEVLCVTLEPPWKNNEHNVSCIPAGTYQCHRALHHKEYEVWELADVPGRAAIHIHVGNFVANTQGCPLVGTSYGPDHSITESKRAFDRFMARTKNATSLTLEIKEAWCADATGVAA